MPTTSIRDNLFRDKQKLEIEINAKDKEIKQLKEKLEKIIN